MHFTRQLAISILVVATCCEVYSACAQTAVSLANAEVLVRSSMSPSFVGMANTDAAGHFTIKGVPKGGINVVFRRNNVVIAQGATIFAGGDLTDVQVAPYLLDPTGDHLKSGPGK